MSVNSESMRSPDPHPKMKFDTMSFNTVKLNEKNEIQFVSTWQGRFYSLYHGQAYLDSNTGITSKMVQDCFERKFQEIRTNYASQVQEASKKGIKVNKRQIKEQAEREFNRYASAYEKAFGNTQETKKLIEEQKVALSSRIEVAIISQRKGAPGQLAADFEKNLEYVFKFEI
jgi:hypothetical protein